MSEDLPYRSSLLHTRASERIRSCPQEPFWETEADRADPKEICRCDFCVMEWIKIEMRSPPVFKQTESACTEGIDMVKRKGQGMLCPQGFNAGSRLRRLLTANMDSYNKKTTQAGIEQCRE